MGCFNFTRSFRPGAENRKPDALSHHLGKEEVEVQPETILPTSCMVAAVTWHIEEEVRAAQLNQPDPGNGPPERLFVPDAVRSSVGTFLQAHLPPWSNTHLNPHSPAILVSNDGGGYSGFCLPVCAQNNVSTQPSPGLLHPFPIPGWLWSYIALDFDTGLPASNGYTVILTVIDLFFKFSHFIPLSKLPTARFDSTAFPLMWYRDGAHKNLCCLEVFLCLHWGFC